MKKAFDAHSAKHYFPYFFKIIFMSHSCYFFLLSSYTHFLPILSGEWGGGVGPLLRGYKPYTSDNIMCKG